jgi:hypothetical protein
MTADNPQTPDGKSFGTVVTVNPDGGPRSSAVCWPALAPGPVERCGASIPSCAPEASRGGCIRSGAAGTEEALWSTESCGENDEYVY